MKIRKMSLLSRLKKAREKCKTKGGGTTIQGSLMQNSNNDKKLKEKRLLLMSTHTKETMMIHLTILSVKLITNNTKHISKTNVTVSQLKT